MKKIKRGFAGGEPAASEMPASQDRTEIVCRVSFVGCESEACGDDVRSLNCECE